MTDAIHVSQAGSFITAMQRIRVHIRTHKNFSSRPKQAALYTSVYTELSWFWFLFISSIFYHSLSMFKECEWPWNMSTLINESNKLRCRMNDLAKGQMHLNPLWSAEGIILWNALEMIDEPGWTQYLMEGINICSVPLSSHCAVGKVWIMMLSAVDKETTH